MSVINLNLKNRKVLIVGGGKVAKRKAELFDSDGAIITIISKEIDNALLKYNTLQKEIEDQDLRGYFLVYAATNDYKINHHIVEVCNELNMLVGSATSDEDVSFNSVSYYQHPLGTIAFSSHTTFPYMTPMLEKMSEVLDDNEERLSMLVSLRNALTQKGNIKEIIECLYTADINILKFLVDVTKSQGYVYVHHNEKEKQDIKVNKYPSLIVSIGELEMYIKAFNAFNITYIPLVVSEGHILDKINTITQKMLKPLIESDDDLEKVLSLFKKDNTELCVYLHPRKHIAYSVNQREHVEFHLLNEHVTFNMNKHYKVISFLMNHGNHYQQVNHHIISYNENGFRVENLGVLSDHKAIIEMLEKKNC